MMDTGGAMEEVSGKTRITYGRRIRKEKKKKKSQDIIVEFPLDPALGSLKVDSVLTELCLSCFTETESFNMNTLKS